LTELPPVLECTLAVSTVPASTVPASTVPADGKHAG
jgi:hypothetical protein